MFKKKINDPAFGEMIYNYRWERKIEIFLFSTIYEISLVAKVFDKKPINDIQREKYLAFKKDETSILKKIEKSYKSYLEKYKNELALSQNTTNLSEFIIPRSLIFNQRGEACLLFDCCWDEEHGTGISIDDFSIGSQDIFL